jgi:N-6 DNA Methylase
MANEELTQRGYLSSGKLRGEKFGDFERFNVGGTTVREFVSSGITAILPTAIDYPFKKYKPPKIPGAAKPDCLYVGRKGYQLAPVAVGESKAPSKLLDGTAVLKAAEQAFFAAKAIGARVGITTNGKRYLYVDVASTEAAKTVVYFDEKRDLNPAVLQNLLAGDAGVLKDPKPLAETVWQIIWHATKAEPKECLLTFVEIFVLKFLSDNLPQSTLPGSFSFYALLMDPKDFYEQHGTSAIEYYVSTIRPRIKTLFPDNVVVQDPSIPAIFGLSTLVSKTSIINGFAFLRSSTKTVATFNRTFLEILAAFKEFGPLTSINPEFKLRLYETFLRRSARQQKLGHFFTPRNVVRPMIRMARLARLPKGSIVLDPAAGVGGFILEPLLFPDALPKNVKFVGGRPTVRVRTVGIDVDANVHIRRKPTC